MTKIQEFVQKKCVMAAHPECKTYEEALKQDFLISEISRETGLRCIPEEICFTGLPITLSRILNAMKIAPFEIKAKDIFNFIDTWNYVDTYGSDLHLDDQTEEKQLETAKILGYEDGK